MTLFPIHINLRFADFENNLGAEAAKVSPPNFRKPNIPIEIITERSVAVVQAHLNQIENEIAGVYRARAKAIHEASEPRHPGDNWIDSFIARALGQAAPEQRRSTLFSGVIGPSEDISARLRALEQRQAELQHELRAACAIRDVPEIYGPFGRKPKKSAFAQAMNQEEE